MGLKASEAEPEIVAWMVCGEVRFRVPFVTFRLPLPEIVVAVVEVEIADWLIVNVVLPMFKLPPAPLRFPTVTALPLTSKVPAWMFNEVVVVQGEPEASCNVPAPSLVSVPVAFGVELKVRVVIGVETFSVPPDMPTAKFVVSVAEAPV